MELFSTTLFGWLFGFGALFGVQCALALSKLIQIGAAKLVIRFKSKVSK